MIHDTASFLIAQPSNIIQAHKSASKVGINIIISDHILLY